MVRVRLVSFGLVLGVAFLLIVSLVLDTAIQAAGMWLFGNSPFVILGDITQLAAGLLILSVAFGALMKFLPDAPVEWRDAMVGGLVSALLFSAGKKLFALYLTHAGTASAFGAAGSLAVLLMWLYFSAAVLLLGAELSAARARLHDPRGAWGMQNNGRVPPGSRAKIGSMLAASTRTAAPLQAAAVVASASTVAPMSPASARVDAPVTAAARRSIGSIGAHAQRTQELTGQARKKVSAVKKALEISRKLARAETRATQVTARAMIGAGRKASDANKMVRRHPWRAVLVAASAGMAVALMSRRDGERDDTRV
jgi:membrane protein